MWEKGRQLKSYDGITYTYDAWGKCTIVFDSTDVSIATINPYRYRGYYYDVETGLYYLQSRYYDAEVGRFVNADEACVLVSLFREKYAILAMFTANVTFNSFAAEVWFHADALTDWLSILDSYYSKALRADMAIGEDNESGIFDRYYDLNSDMVKAQIAIHGER